MKTLTSSVALASVLATAPTLAASESTFRTLDADRNLKLSDTEFQPLSQRAFSAWDIDANQRVSQAEFGRGIFRAWDRDGDGQLDQSDFERGSLAWFGDANLSFSDFDANSDGALTEHEFASSLQDSPAMANWDFRADGMNVARFHQALFATYDAGADGALAQDDYARFDNRRITGDTAQAGAITDEPQPVARDEQTAAVGEQPVPHNEIGSRSQPNQDQLYPEGVSVNYMIDDAKIYGPSGDEIGSVENVVFSRDGKVLSLVAEVGGFRDLFDTHVSVPWDQVDRTEPDRLIVPVTEENVEGLSKTDRLTASEAGAHIRAVEDDFETGPQAFRATDLIGVYARVRDDDAVRENVNFGRVSDLIIRGGKLQSVVVIPDTGYGLTGPHPYPYHAEGWAPDAQFYAMQYSRSEIAQTPQQLDNDSLNDAREESGESEDMPETVLPDRPEDKIIEGTNRNPPVDADPTPQAGTSGTIPGYDPADEDQFEARPAE